MTNITRHTFNFLQELKSNNHKEWFTANKERYEHSKNELCSFADDIIAIVNSFDVIENLNGKKSLYRIFKDVRFSKDKTPYKSHWSGYLRRAGAERRGGYHFSISPGNSYISGGFFGPSSEDLLQLRKQIEADASPLREILSLKSFKAYFGNLNGEQVKTAPKGFDKMHENIDLLRYKQFYVVHSFTDDEVLAENFEEQVAEGFRKMLPFFEVMTSYLLTNLNGEPMEAGQTY